MSKRNKKTREAKMKKGLTLTELVVAFAITGIAGTLLLGFLQQQNDFLENSVIQGDIRTKAQIALDVMANELRQATRKAAGSPPNATITDVNGNPTLTFYVPADVNGDGRIIDGAGNIEWDTVQSIQYQYNAALKQIIRTQGAATHVIATHVNSASFQDQTSNALLNANEIRLQMTFQEQTSHRRIPTATVATVVTLRN